MLTKACISIQTTYQDGTAAATTTIQLASKERMTIW